MLFWDIVITAANMLFAFFLYLLQGQNLSDVTTQVCICRLKHQGLGHTLQKTSGTGSVTASSTDVPGTALPGSTSESGTGELCVGTSSRSAGCWAALEAIILWFTSDHVGFAPLSLRFKWDSFFRACVYHFSRGNKKCLVMFDLLESSRSYHTTLSTAPAKKTQRTANETQSLPGTKVTPNELFIKGVQA